ncbi:MAG: thermopsin family protease [Thermoplasmata archaeon]|nr:thermopsin family protease [Thermoplasmata archaeon]
MRRRSPTFPSRVLPGWLIVLALGMVLPALAPSALGGPPPAPATAPVHGDLRALPAAIPLHPPAHRPAMLHRDSVNPYAFYASEPAPMGITDFGVNATGGGYTYQSSAFYGLTTIHKLATFSPGAGSNALSIQLNIVLTFTVGGTSYAYWVQDVAFVDTTQPSSPSVAFENNIWNFSSASASLDSGSVTGNGSLQQVGASLFAYITGAASGLPGNGVTLTLPTEIGLLASVIVVNTQPEVVFQYRDGHGLVTYDNALFPFAKKATNINYTVDGTNYNNFGLYNDAELILGGPGGGSSTGASSAQLSMSLEFYNGRNFQSVPNAYNFGSDTAESISNLSTSLGWTGRNGSLMDNLSYSTSGVLGGVYNDSYAGTVEIVTQAPTGTVVINGTSGIRFQQQPINLTMAPGNFSFSLYNGATLLGKSIATLKPGGFLLLFIDAGTVSTITFLETGLTSGHAWSVSLGASTQTSKSDTIRFLTINGTVGWRLTPVPGFLSNVSRGQLSIAGQGATVDINFTEIFYAIQLVETGLPAGTNWSVTLQNLTDSSSGVGIALQLPNGTFAFTVGHVDGYWIGSPSSGQLSVNGAKVQHTLAFRPFTYSIAVAESGLPPNTPWGVDVGGLWTNGTLQEIRVNQVNGTYTFGVDAAAGYIVNQSVSSVEVNASPAFVNVTFQPFRYAVQFVEQGLASGTTWGVQIASNYYPTTGPTIHLLLANGTYSYSVSPLLAYRNLTPLNSSFEVAGQPATIGVTFGPLPAVFGYLTVAVNPNDAILSINGTTTSSPNGTFDIPLAPGRYMIEFTETGYYPDFQNITITAGSHTVLPNVLLKKLQTVQGTKPPPAGGTGAGGIPWTTLEIGGILGIAVLGLVAIALTRRPRPPEIPE